jgi:hypothetical protein
MCERFRGVLVAEAGSNPRDTEKETEGKRGMTVRDCIKNVRRSRMEGATRAVKILWTIDSFRDNEQHTICDHKSDTAINASISIVRI